MKKFLIPFAFILCIATFLLSCEKEEEKTNYFSIKGKSYSIDEAYVFKLIVDATDQSPEINIYQFIFDHIKDGDTTSLYLAAVDYNNLELGGKYLSRDLSSDELRGIFPYLFFAFSLVTYPNGDVYFSGDGGDFNVVKDGGDYTLKFNSIAMGDYDEAGNFLPFGKTAGNFKGLIPMSVENMSMKSAQSRLLRINEKYRKVLLPD